MLIYVYSYMRSHIFTLIYVRAEVTAENIETPKLIRMATVVCCQNWEDVDTSNSLRKESLTGVFTSHNS